MIAFVLLSLEDLSYATKIISGVLHINDSLMNKYVDIQLKLEIQNFFKKQSVLIALIYSPSISIYFILLTVLHNLKALFMGSFPQLPPNCSYIQSYIFKTEILGYHQPAQSNVVAFLEKPQISIVRQEIPYKIGRVFIGFRVG